MSPNKIKDLVKSFKIEKVTEEVSRAMDKMNQELMQSSTEKPAKPPRQKRREKTPEERREDHLVKGTIKFFSGIGLSIFLYFMAGALIGKLPPAILDGVPINLDPFVQMAWLVGVIPVFSGVGHMIAGLLIRRKNAPVDEATEPTSQIESAQGSPLRIESPQFNDEVTLVGEPRMPPASVTDRTTNILEKVSRHRTNELESEH